MPEQRRTVFISCGQFTAEERELGGRVCKLVDDATPFQGYFAENEVSLNGLSENILKRLYNSVGLIAIMHHRGIVNVPPPESTLMRASVWVEQEIAIAAFMQQVLNRSLHVALFIQKGVKLEGIRTQLQLIPVEFDRSEDVITRLREILPTWKEPLFLGDDEQRQRLDAIDVSAKVIRSANRSVTLEIKNHSEEVVEVERILLLNDDKRLCDPIYRPANTQWTLRGSNGYLPITLNVSEEIGYRLIGFYGKFPEMFAAQNHGPHLNFPADVTVELQCKILGMKRTMKDTGSVQVNLFGRDVVGI